MKGLVDVIVADAERILGRVGGFRSIGHAFLNGWMRWSQFWYGLRPMLLMRTLVRTLPVLPKVRPPMAGVHVPSGRSPSISISASTPPSTFFRVAEPIFFWVSKASVTYTGSS